MSDDIRYDRHGAVRLITINRPAKMNSLDFDANDALVEAWKAFDDDDDAGLEPPDVVEQKLAAAVTRPMLRCRLNHGSRYSGEGVQFRDW